MQELDPVNDTYLPQTSNEDVVIQKPGDSIGSWSTRFPGAVRAVVLAALLGGQAGRIGSTCWRNPFLTAQERKVLFNPKSTFLVRS